MIIPENEMLQLLADSKRVSLIEPPYVRKYIPPGLAKIASYVKGHGGEVTFSRGPQGEPADLIAITSLFTQDSGDVISAIHQARFLSPGVPILVGGVYATLMTKHLQRNIPDDVMIFKGYSKALDHWVPDYSIDWLVEEPWDEFSYTFTTRGCPNKCPYCAVWRIEPGRWINPTWKDHIVLEKPCATISDNNLTAAPGHLEEVIDYLASTNRKVMLDSGVDCHYITPELAESLARLRFVKAGMRMAFDRMDDDGVFQNAMRLLLDAGVPASNMLVFVLYNFNEMPREAEYRMREVAKLGVRPYPQQYIPLNKTDRKDTYIGKHWTPNLARTFRLYWLLPVYKTATFEEHIPEIPLTKKDWVAWYAGRENDQMGTEEVAQAGNPVSSNGPVVIRRKGHVKALRDHMQKELDGLPERDIFGTSTADAKADLGELIADLEAALGGAAIDPDTEVGDWLTNPDAYLGKDYGVG